MMKHYLQGMHSIQELVQRLEEESLEHSLKDLANVGLEDKSPLTWANLSLLNKTVDQELLGNVQ